MPNPTPVKAVALFSGGLDSMIACRLMADLGVEVTAVWFDIGFGVSDEKRAWLERTAAMSRVKLMIVDITDQFVGEVLFNPKYGYGSAFNPCIDCHANMFRHAEKIREALGADFLISGEVLGERPFSQNRQALDSVAKHSGAREKIVRPLSAKLLPPTQAEIDGLIDREKMLDLSGRGRKRQIELAAQYGFDDYESPAGGCLYTDPGFGARIEEQTRHEKPLPSEIKLFRLGRHLRLPGKAKLIIGRNKAENDKILALNPERFDAIEMPDDLYGPASLLQKTANEADRLLAARIILTYARTDPTQSYTLQIGQQKTTAQPFEEKKSFTNWLI